MKGLGTPYQITKSYFVKWPKGAYEFFTVRGSQATLLIKLGPGHSPCHDVSCFCVRMVRWPCECVVITGATGRSGRLFAGFTETVSSCTAGVGLLGVRALERTVFKRASQCENKTARAVVGSELPCRGLGLAVLICVIGVVWSGPGRSEAKSGHKHGLEVWRAPNLCLCPGFVPDRRSRVSPNDPYHTL